MTGSDDLAQRTGVVETRAGEVWRVLLRSLALVQFGLIVACVAVPLLGVDDDPDPSGASSASSSSRQHLQTFSLLRALPYYLSGKATSFGDVRDHPLSVPGGRTATIVLLVVLVALLVLAAASAIGVGGEIGGRAVIVLGTLTGVLLIVATVALAFVQKWLSNNDVATPWQPGLWLPIATGVWLLSMTRARRGWENV